MRQWIGSLNIAFSMYSTIKMPRINWEKENMRYVMCFFPLVGIVIGCLLCVCLWLTDMFGIGRVLTAVLATLVPLAVSGGIHMDGFCDTVDALASHAEIERKLEILKDPHTGAFAVIGCNLYILLTFGLWTQIVLDIRTIAMLAVGFALSRSMSGFSVVTLKCAKNSGLVALFSNAAEKKRTRTVMLVWIAVCAVAMVLISPFVGGGCLIAATCVLYYYKSVAYRAFGGITGDLAGYFLQLCEVAMLAATAVMGGILA